MRPFSLHEPIANFQFCVMKKEKKKLVSTKLNRVAIFANVMVNVGVASLCHKMY